MPRALRLTLWTVSVLVVLIGAAVLWIDSQLRPEPLGLRVKELLAKAKIEGGITKVEASLDGTFSADGINLTLEDGTKIKAASIKGEAALFSILTGTYALNNFEAKGLDISLSAPSKSSAKNPAPKTPTTKPTLPRFALGPYSASGKVTLVDGTLIRFSLQGDEFNSSKSVDLRIGVAWPGFLIGSTLTDPRGEITLKADFRRPLGAAGLTPENLAADINRCELRLAAKDASAISAGSIEFQLSGAYREQTHILEFTGDIRDSGGRNAVNFKGSDSAGKITVSAQLDLDPKRFGILSASLPDCRLTGKIDATTGNAQWGGKADLKAVFPDLNRWSKSIPKNTRSEWELKAAAQSSPEGFVVEQLSLSGHGILVSIPQTLRWKGGLLPEESAGASLRLAAQDADLVALTPFLALGGLATTEGKWTGEAEISFNKGQPEVASIRPHSIKGLTIEKAGKLLVRQIDAEFPLKSENGALLLAPINIGSAAGNIASGDVTFTPGKDGAWSVNGHLNVGIAELAAQPGWEDLPLEKLRGIRIDTHAAVNCAAGKSPVVSSADSIISRQGTRLLSLKLRQPYPVGGPRPSGVLVEANAANLPLESVAALVPGLKLTGNLNRADLVAGFKTEGFFVRTEGAPMAFAETSVTWADKTWVKQCDLNASLDLLIGDKTTVLSFNQAELKNRERLIASGNITLGFGGAPTTLKLHGNLGALAEQPFAGPLSMIATGEYTASAERSAGGEIALALDVNDVTIKQNESQIKLARVRGKYAPTAHGLTASGQFSMLSKNQTLGKFTLVQTATGAKTDWDANVTIESVAVDDFVSLMPKSTDEPVPKVTLKPKPDLSPFWHNQTGQLHLTIGQASAFGIVAEKIILQAEGDEKSLRLLSLKGKLAEGNLEGLGTLTFQPTTSNGPYVLDCKLGIKQLELGGLAKAFPVIKEYVQGKADADLHAVSIAGTAGELPSKLQLDAIVSSRGGRLQAFGGRTGGTALMADKAGQIGETLGGLAILAGALTKNKGQGEKIAKMGAAVSAAAKLQKILSDFNYDTADFRVSRLASGTIKLDLAEVKNKTLHLGAKGGISMRPELSFSDWPLVVDAQLRGSGELAEYFNALGFGSGIPQPDGLTEGPGIKLTGSLNDMKNDLSERLQTALDKIKSGSAYQEGNPAAVPASGAGSNKNPASNSTPKKRDALSDLLKELGK